MYCAPFYLHRIRQTAVGGHGCNLVSFFHQRIRHHCITNTVAVCLLFPCHGALSRHACGLSRPSSNLHGCVFDFFANLKTNPLYLTNMRKIIKNLARPTSARHLWLSEVYDFRKLCLIWNYIPPSDLSIYPLCRKKRGMQIFVQFTTQHSWHEELQVK